MTPVSIIYITGRQNPMWEMFCDTFYGQTTPEQRENIQVIFIDGRLWGLPTDRAAAPEGAISLRLTAWHDSARRLQLQSAVAGRFDYLHIPPLPSPWQGAFRQTSKDFFCAGLSRDTGFVVARHPYLVFVDDLSALMPGYMNQVAHAAKNRYIACGAYKKVKNLHVVYDAGDNAYRVIHDEFPPGVDSRWSSGSDAGIVPWVGSGMYGCSFGIPLEAGLEVDGNDGACCSQGGEDTEFGIRLQRAGWAFFYNRNMLTLESEEGHYLDTPIARLRKQVTTGLPAGYEGETWSDHVVLNRVVRETDRIHPLIGSNLRALRTRYLETGFVPVPRAPVYDWRDGAPLSSL